MNTKKAIYKQAPLPFMGQKSKMLGALIRILNTFNISKDCVFLDCFGGSGLLSHTIKQEYFENRVIYNDYDNFLRRLELIDTTEEIRKGLLKIVGAVYKLSLETIEKIKEFLEGYDDKEIDFITLASYLKFIGGRSDYLTKDVFFKENTFYNRIRLTKLESNRYLEGVEIVSCDFREMLEQNFNENSILILDPPYLNTQRGHYKNQLDEEATLIILEYVKKARYFVFFTSNISHSETFFKLSNIPYNKLGRTLAIGNKLDLMLFSKV
ncbi:DNA adenine methylase [Helicobacter sp. WB40]|uniref:DNA adenine methylase n=1 Tax=Helicobacter sp. WB40 TaxID=3004130 RepID=UPI0022EBC762|nr:DNA adenine methylase [Helicobacter sp. WB40]MDA3968040.1 DNA adenine methylase [Helicobacter sp. WB40]